VKGRDGKGREDVWSLFLKLNYDNSPIIETF